jgi:hypothetical protein
MIKVQSLNEAVKYASLFAKILRKYSYPLVGMDIEEIYLPYRTWSFNVDGYVVCVHLTDMVVNDSVIQNLQIFPVRMYCLPWHVYFKIAVAFLGTEGIVNFSIMRHGHLVSCWTKIVEKSKSGSVSVRKDVIEDSYLGVKFGYL